MRRPGAPLVIAVMCIVAAVLKANQLAGQVRWVDIVALFGTGFGAGAGVISAFMQGRRAAR